MVFTIPLILLIFVIGEYACQPIKLAIDLDSKTKATFLLETLRAQVTLMFLPPILLPFRILIASSADALHGHKSHSVYSCQELWYIREGMAHQ
jgi:hypothetical protein